jgi:hypothetical protein
MDKDEQFWLAEAMSDHAPHMLRPTQPAQVCDCGQRLSSFLQDLREELQADDTTLFMMLLPKKGRISLHWSRR